MAQITEQIGFGTSSPANTMYAPVYRFSATSATNTNRSLIIFEESELQGIGLSAGMEITQIAFNKTNSGTFNSGIDYTVRMGTSSATAPLTGTIATEWNNILATHTTVYTSASFNVPSNSGWFTITLDQPFIYNGGTLEISFDQDMTGVTATDAIKWEYTSGFDTYIIGANESNSNLTSYKYRPNIQITFQGGTPCSGQPDAGTVTNLAVCPDVSFSLSADGGSALADIERQWQESPAGQNNWSDIPGAIYSSFLMTNGINVDMDYRMIITCTNSNLSDTTDILEVTVNEPTDCYCEPSTTNGATYHITNFTTTGGTTNINNNSTGSADGYEDYSHLSVSTHVGATIEYSISTHNTTSTYGRAMWIDWNQNGVFEANEKVLSSTAYEAGPFTGDFTVPIGVQPGDYRMRVLASFTPANPDDPCYNNGSGEYEDYTVNIYALSDCTDADAGAISSNKSQVCEDETFILSATGVTDPGNGLTYQWQESPAGQNNWTDITGVVSLNLSITGLTDDTDYRLIVSCSFGNLSDTSNIVTVTSAPANACYCTPPPPSIANTYWIDGVSTTGAVSNFSNLGTGFSTDGYADYTGIHEVEAIAGSSFDLEVQSQNGATSGIKVWIDWNQNGVFDSDELIYQSNSGASSSLNIYDINVQVPTTAVLGTTRMRIRNYNTSTLDVCNQMSYGEAEDYDVTILPMPDCNTVSTPSDWELLVSKDVLCIEEDIDLSLSAPVIASDVTYQFQSSTDGISWNNLGTASNATSITANDVDEDTYFRVQWLCNNVVSGIADSVLITAANPEILSVTNGQVCGEGTVDLSATSSNGTEVIWYEDAAGTVVLHEGNNFTTPNLTSTTTYYVAASLGGASASDGSLTTLSSGGTSCTGGIMFDLTPNFNMTIDSFEARAAGVVTNVDVYIKTGTSVGSETVQSDWTLHESVTVNGTTNQMFMITLDDPIQMIENQVYGIYLNYNASYTNNPNTTYFNDDLTLEATYGMCGLFSSPNTPRIFNGTVFYTGSPCASNLEEVVATVHPEFSITIDGLSVACEGETVTLDAGSGYNSYSWNTNANTQTIDVTSAGNYSVVVEDQNGCIAEGDIDVAFNTTPVVDLGEDIYVCGGVSVELDAGNPGRDYLWSTGATTQTIQVMSPGVYSVEVSHGPCSAEDSIEIFSQEYANASQITVTHLEGRKYQFGLANAVNVDEYLWNFGDGATSTDANPIHEFPATGDFLVILKLFNEGCGEGATLVHLIEERPVDIKEMDRSRVNIYPNPAKDYITIELNENNTIEYIEIKDIAGRTVLYESVSTMDHKYRLTTEKLSSGIYHVVIYSAEGIIQRNIEIIK